MNDDIIDLNDLAPKSVRVKYGEEVIEVLPPKMSDLVHLANTAQRIRGLVQQEGELDASAVAVLENELTVKLYELIPQLKDHNLSMAQMTILISTLTKMSIPQDAKELEKRGITADASKKAD